MESGSGKSEGVVASNNETTGAFVKYCDFDGSKLINRVTFSVGADVLSDEGVCSGCGTWRVLTSENGKGVCCSCSCLNKAASK